MAQEAEARVLYRVARCYDLPPSSGESPSLADCRGRFNTSSVSCWSGFSDKNLGKWLLLDLNQPEP